MVPTDHVKPLLPSSLFRLKHILRGHRKTVTRRIVAAIHEWKEAKNLARAIILSEKRAATFMRVSFRAVSANFLSELLGNLKIPFRHGYSSSQNLSLRYFDALSAKTVTIFARSLEASFFATSKQPASASS